jgi:hypothetical protein
MAALSTPTKPDEVQDVLTMSLNAAWSVLSDASKSSDSAKLHSLREEFGLARAHELLDCVEIELESIQRLLKSVPERTFEKLLEECWVSSISPAQCQAAWNLLTDVQRQLPAIAADGQQSLTVAPTLAEWGVINAVELRSCLPSQLSMLASMLRPIPSREFKRLMQRGVILAAQAK